MMLCNEILAERGRFTAAEAHRIGRVLEQWRRSHGSAKKIIDNLCTDSRLGPSARAELLRTIAKHPNAPTDWSSLKAAYDAACLNYLLQGGECGDIPRSRMLWRAVRPHSLARHLEKACYWPPEAIQELISTLSLPEPPTGWRWTLIQDDEPLVPHFT